MADKKSGINRRDLLRGSGAALSFFIFRSAAAEPESLRTEFETAKTAGPYRNEDVLYRNEHPLGVSSQLRENLKKSCETDPFHHYKLLELQTDELKKLLILKSGLNEKILFLAPGAGPTLEKFLNTIRIENATFAISDPDFYYLSRVAEYMKIKMTKVPTTADYQIDLNALAKTKANYVYISNPHVPYGRARTKTEIESFLKAVGPKTTLIIDEAYTEFSPRHNEITCLDLVPKYKNLVVVRTFSKIYGLAALRIGYYATQNKKFSEYFTIYTTSAFSAKAATLSLNDHARFQETFNFVKQAKEKIQKAAEISKIKCIESEANFLTLLTTAEQKKSIVQKLENLNFRFSPLGKGPLLRISLGSPEALEQAIQTVSQLNQR